MAGIFEIASSSAIDADELWSKLMWIRSTVPTLLEDHVLLLRLESEAELASLTLEGFERNMRDTVLPQFQIVRNMGFSADWRHE